MGPERPRKLCTIIPLLVGLAICCAAGCKEVDRRDAPSRSETYRTAPLKPGTLTIPKGTMIHVRLGERLDSDTTHEGHRFTTSALSDVRADSAAVAMPRGTLIYGYVADIQRIVNRTSMRLRFDMADLPDGRRLVLSAEPAQGSKIDMDELAEKGAKEAGGFAVKKGIDAVTGGVLFPLWVYMSAKKAYGFVTKESRMIFPKDCIMTIELGQPVYVPPPER